MDKERFKTYNIDYEEAVRRFAGKEDLYEKYFMKFMQDTYVVDAERYLSEKNYEELLKTVHALKGASGTLGINGVFETSQAVVEALRAEKIEEIPALMNELHKEYDRIVELVSE